MSTDPDFFDTVGAFAQNGRRVRAQYLSPAAPSTPFDLANSSQNSRVTSSCWAQNDNAYYGVAKALDTIPPGLYRCEISERVGPVFLRQTIELDGIIPLPDSASEEVVREIREFRGMKYRFQAHGFLHKRGILLWGPAGGGKTITIHQICQLIVEGDGGIAILVDVPKAAADCLQLLRRIEPERPVVVIFEDLDALVDRYGENEYLALLDGETQVDNCVFVASTNYPERLDARFVDRPSRFDTVKYIGMPSREARETFLAMKAPALVNGQLEAYVDASDGFSIAHLKELIVLTQCFGYTLQDAMSRLRRMKIKPNAEKSPDRMTAGL